jgi:hypothetical protein
VTLKYRITVKNSQEQLHGEVQVQNIGRVTLKYRITSKNSREQLHGEVQVQNIGNLIEGDCEEPEKLPPYYIDRTVIHMCSCITVTESLGVNIKKTITNFLNRCAMKNIQTEEGSDLDAPHQLLPTNCLS